MRRLRPFLIIFLALGFFLAAAGAASGQDDGDSTEFWPEIDIWFRLSPAWRLSSFAAQSRNVETDYREGSLIAQADYAFGTIKHGPKRRMLDETRALEMRRFLLRAGYQTGKSLDDGGLAYRERLALLELHFRTPFKHGVLVSHRLRSDLRWMGDDAPEFSTRLRYPEVITINGLRMLEEAIGKPASVEYGPPNMADMLSNWADVSKAGQLLGWEPQFSLQNGVQRLVDWYRTERDWARSIHTP